MEPLFTNYTSTFIGCLDYIFYNTAGGIFHKTGVTKLPPLELFQSIEGYPTKNNPSDHLFLCMQGVIECDPAKQKANFSEEEEEEDEEEDILKKEQRPTIDREFFQAVYTP